MSEKETCSIVQDLLPSHLEHLTKEETNQFIVRHIGECEECKQVLKVMEAEPPRKRASAMREINYLFKVKRALILKCILAFALAVAILSPVVYEIFIKDYSLPASEVTITDVYRLSNGKICYRINYEKPSSIGGYTNWLSNDEGLAVSYFFLAYDSRWYYWTTPKSASVLHDVILTGEDYDEESKLITTPLSAIYYGDPTTSHTPILIWQEGMEIEDAPAEIEKEMQDSDVHNVLF